MKTSELTGAALDWAVAKCEGHSLPPFPGRGHTRGPKQCWINVSPAGHETFSPSTDWAQGGTLIEREGIGFFCNRTTATGARFTPDAGADWRAFALNKHGVHYFGPTPLIAAMRCFCASRLGDEVEVPKELK